MPIQRRKIHLDLILCPVCGCRSGEKLLSAPDRFHRRDKPYQLLRCSWCSLVWLGDPPKPEEMPYHYGIDYHKAITIAGESKLDKRWNYPRKRILRMVQGGSLLDIGCSSGGFLRALKNDGWDLHGLEISPDQAKKAELGSGAKVFVGGILEAPFNASSFDVITGFHVLEHVYDPITVIGRLWEWLKPGGVLYLQVPNIEALDARLFGSCWYGLELPRHLYHFSPTSLRCLFSPFDFEEVLIRTLPYTHVEESMHYLRDNIRARFRLTPIDRNAQPGMLWKSFRKAIRIGVLKPLGYLSMTVGCGAGIEAIYRKPVSSRLPTEMGGLDTEPFRLTTADTSNSK
jgi:SAM-dependent methyltransferase